MQELAKLTKAFELLQKAHLLFSKTTCCIPSITVSLNTFLPFKCNCTTILVKIAFGSFEWKTYSPILAKKMIRIVFWLVFIFRLVLLGNNFLDLLCQGLTRRFFICRRTVFNTFFWVTILSSEGVWTEVSKECLGNVILLNITAAFLQS